MDKRFFCTSATARRLNSCRQLTARQPMSSDFPYEPALNVCTAKARIQIFAFKKLPLAQVVQFNDKASWIEAGEGKSYAEKI